MQAKLLDSFTPIAGFRDQLHVRLQRQQSRDPLDDQRMIIDDKNSDWNRIAAQVSLRSATSFRQIPPTARPPLLPSRSNQNPLIHYR
ncbi:MAG TPA: hypothetical protein VMA54_21995 [Steroidobacteraceae bacterium]|nr:hypothetical protein [Steroidobacteraceae bacterium]